MTRRGFHVMALAALMSCTPVAKPITPQRATLDVHVDYRRAADVFEILDNVSLWRDGKDVQYREAWRERFGLTEDDKRQFAAYAKIRKRYDDRKVLDDHGLFAPRKSPDRVAHAFYAADTLPAAFDQLTKFMVAADIDTLRAFYAAFEAQYEQLLHESRAFAEAVSELEGQLDDPRVRDFFARVATSYAVHDAPTFTVLYVWWPPIAHTTASTRDHVLLLQYHPQHHQKSARDALGVLVHELMHHLSTHQPATQKRRLTRVFESGCQVDADKVAPAAILEEPLAVAHQKLFESSRGPVHFERPWYGGHPWVSPFAKAIYEPVRAAHLDGRRIDAQLMTEVSAACERLTAGGLP